ncbi:acyltransferase domain-containing protein [Zhouia spongiae]|uniref:Acyltransferase domain-containing protein n=1 Tax=Zhouia spongiae TaxID=2202721 RepID=A0ABY3YKV9_9FLAO|nr:type I polyketide synthase [Zhouia spongiae]UNY98306.1 acyltransferase domain-containing protein [Zhouia spongiae]
MEEIEKKKYTGLEVAVIGLSGRFPGSNDIQGFWHNLIEGKESIKFYNEEELKSRGLNSKEINHKKFIPAHGAMFEPDTFDANFFNYIQDEARMMDPQIRIYHECVWNALEDSGYNPDSFSGRIGLFSGASENITWKAYAILNASKSGAHDFYIDQLSNKDFLSTLISYKLNLKGPSININTACSTSLVAIHTAIRSLLTGECEIALAGGVSFTSNIKNGYKYEEGMIYSNDGHCRTFDENSSGTVSGDGAGVVVLKKLKDAIRDNDNIYAIVKGSSVNNDGIRKVGYSSPSVEGQIECVKLAHKISRVTADSISYIEAHGTATNLGDPIEIEALNNAFNNNKKKHCGIGSVKTNIGHLDAAAGVAGFIKVVLSLYNKKIPKSLHFTKPNKNIAFDEGPFYTINKLKEWKSVNDMPLRAGVSSFGIGGTNAHVILEEPPKVNKEPSKLPYSLLTLSAKNETSLDHLAIKFEKYLLNCSESLENIAYTLNIGRKDFPYRKSIITNDLNKLKAGLKASQPLNYSQNTFNGEYNPIVFLFSGQGSQYLNMSKELYESYSEFRYILDKGFVFLKKISNGKDFKKILFNDNDNAESFLSRTDNTQPLLFLVEYALASLLISFGIEPQYIIGHSLGEYVGACISNVFSFEEGIFLVYHRGRLMNDLPEGDMISAVIGEVEAKEFISNDIQIAAINNDDQCVFSGSKEAIKKLNIQLNELEITNKRINTSHAFHSNLMEPMLSEFEDVCNQISFSSPKYKIISNITGEFITEDEIKKSSYWKEQIISPVRFNSCVKTLFSEKKNKIFIEIGPGSTLLNLIGQNERSKQRLIKAKIASLPTRKANSNACLTMVSLLETLWQLGKQVNWQNYYKNKQVFKLSLPKYPFLKNKFPAEVDPYSNVAAQVNVKPKKESVFNSFYQEVWTNVVYPECNSIKNKINNSYLLFETDQIIIREIKDLLRKQGSSFVEISLGNKFKKLSKYKYQVCGTELNDMSRLLEDLKSDNISYEKIIYGWGLSNDDKEIHLDKDLTIKNQFESIDFKRILNLIKSLEYQNLDKKVVLGYLSYNFHQVFAGEKSEYKYATSIGLLKSFSMENNYVDCFSLDIDKEDNYAQAVLNEFNQEKPDFNIAYRKQTRWLNDYKRIQLNSNINLSSDILLQEGVYIITGGLGSVGRTFCEYLTSNFNARVVLLGRNDIPKFSQWSDLLASSSISERMKMKLRFLLDMKKLNSKVEYHNLDISDLNSLNSFVSMVEEKFGRVNGVIHAAGVIQMEECYKNILNTDIKFMLPHFKSKAFGLKNLYSVFKDKEIDFIWTTTSLSTVLGGHSLGAYLSSNLFADHFILSKENEKLNWKVVDLDGLDLDVEKSNEKIDKTDLINIFNLSFKIREKLRLIVSTSDLYSKIELTNKKIKDLEYNKTTDYVNENNSRISIESNYVTPISNTEIRLTKLWETFFGITGIGIEDSFFELGGDSLKSMTIIKRMFKEFDVDISLQDFLEKGTIKELSREIDLARRLREISDNSSGTEDLQEMII